MTWYCIAYDVICAKNTQTLTPIDIIIYNINRSYLATLLPKLQWHTEVYEETLHVNSNLETGTYGPKSGVSRIIQESWQHCSFNIS